MTNETILSLGRSGQLVINIEVRPDGASIRFAIPLATGEPVQDDASAPPGSSPLAQDTATAVRVGEAPDRVEGPAFAGPWHSRQSGACVAENGAGEGASRAADEPALSLDFGPVPPKRIIRALGARKEQLRNSVLDYYEDSALGKRALSRKVGAAYSTACQWILEARGNNDPRVIAGDKRRGIAPE